MLGGGRGTEGLTGCTTLLDCSEGEGADRAERHLKLRLETGGSKLFTAVEHPLA